MHAMLLSALDGPDALRWTELPDPVPGPGQVRIAVQVAACNFADILLCQGKYQVKPALPFAPGSEVAGHVEALGPGVDDVEVGERVMASVGHGGYATHVLADAARLHRLPEGMPIEDAAGFGVVYLTAYLALIDRAALAAGESVLVHAAAGGAGLAALQIARGVGARVIAAASSDDKLALCRAQGADETVNSRDPAWDERVRELTGGRGVDVVYDSVGGEVFERSMKCLAFGARVVTLGFASGDIPSVKLNRIMLKNVAITGLHLGAYHEHAPAKLAAAMQRLFELYAEGKVRPRIGGRYPLTDAAKALGELGARRTTGKIVLTV